MQEAKKLEDIIKELPEDIKKKLKTLHCFC
jgi:hypothetical protein